MTTRAKIVEILNKYDELGIYRPDENSESDEEFYVCDEVESLLESLDCKIINCDASLMYCNSASDAYSFSVVWIEDEEVETMLNEQLIRI